MKNLSGNSILIIDADKIYAEKLSNYFISLGAQCTHVKNLESAKEPFKGYDFDLILCSYYLTDGIIHQLIDWCKIHLDVMPVFVVLADVQPLDKNLMSHYSISGQMRKKDNFEELTRDLDNYLFDFEKFYYSIRDMVKPRGIKFEIMTDKTTFNVHGLEIFPKSVLLEPEEQIEVNTQGLLRITVYDGSAIETFLYSGFIAEAYGDGHLFRVYPAYAAAWDRFLEKMDKKQVKINNFMKKAAGT